ncbi:MAG: acyl CoA:acetate/3-ketoacid CoA transferase [Armatimonadetes bacterium]|nr:acyl CoA:acetate/3-ketoacid CoA transferase [Armatimonadota bacterium]
MDRSEAINLIRDGDSVAVVGAGLVMYPEFLVKGIEESYLKKQTPRNLTLVCGCGHGEYDERGDSRFAHPGLLKRAYVTHPDTAPPLRDMLIRGEIEGYNFPQGVMNQLYRCIAAKQPGLFTKIGLGTWIDPRQEGGKINRNTTEDMVKLVNIEGEEWLFYKSFPVHVALIRGTTADEKGNVTIEREALECEVLAVASAAKACGGKVIVQVERVAAGGTLNPKAVVVPGILVDAVVVAEDPDVNHMQMPSTVYNPYFSGEIKPPPSRMRIGARPLDPERVIARRAAMELFPGAVVNLGIGIPATVAEIAEQEGIINDLTFTVELGGIGGLPAGRPDFGAVLNPEAIISQPSMFDIYHGGRLDMTFLGAAEIDRSGNVNVSKFGSRFAGTGGFVDITQSTRKVVFCTFFAAKGLVEEVADGKLIIKKEGEVKKFVEQVEQITFNGKLAWEQQKDVTIVTERGVFKLTRDGLTLVEVAPGVNLEEHILRQMQFRPKISDSLKLMDERIFKPGPMGYFKNL